MLYTIFIYITQYFSALSHAKLTKTKLYGSTYLLIITRLLFRVLFIYLFGWLLNYMVCPTNYVHTMIFSGLVIILSSLASTLGETIVRTIVNQVAYKRAEKAIRSHRDEYGTGYTDNVKEK